MDIPETQNLIAVTGAFSYTGRYIARRLLDLGYPVVTLTNHTERVHLFEGKIRAYPFHFDHPHALAASLEGVSTLYNTYWVRFNRGQVSFDQAIAKKPAGICVFAVEPVLQPQIDKATDAGIPVATILGDLPESKHTAYVGSYQRDLGYMGGVGVAEALGGTGKVAILSIPGVQMLDDREAGYRAAFDKYPGIEVVQVGDTKADTVTAVNVAKDILTANPDLAAFVGTDSTAGIGAATAVEEAGLVGKVKVVAMDRNSDILQKIKEGTLTGTVAHDDAAMAFWCLQVLYNFKHNQAPLTSDNKAAGVTTGPTNVFMWANYIDETNVDYFLPANETYAK